LLVKIFQAKSYLDRIKKIVQSTKILLALLITLIILNHCIRNI
jgi:hypothetical protein